VSRTQAAKPAAIGDGHRSPGSHHHGGKQCQSSSNT
jgi:hypothetical protein